MVRLAAHAGVDPWPLTAWELVEAADAKETSEWNRTADTIANLVNLLGRHVRVFRRDDFHPPLAERNRLAEMDASNDEAS